MHASVEDVSRGWFITGSAPPNRPPGTSCPSHPRTFSVLSTPPSSSPHLSRPAPGEKHRPMSMVHRSRKTLLKIIQMRHKWDQDSSTGGKHLDIQVLPREARPQKKPQALKMNEHQPLLRPPCALCWLQPLGMALQLRLGKPTAPKGRSSGISGPKNTLAPSPSSYRRLSMAVACVHAGSESSSLNKQTPDLREAGHSALHQKRMLSHSWRQNV